MGKDHNTMRRVRKRVNFRKLRGVLEFVQECVINLWYYFIINVTFIWYNYFGVITLIIIEVYQHF